MPVECNHDWANSYSVNKLGTLDSVLECNTCGKRVNEKSHGIPKKLPHLRNVSDKAYETLTRLFKPNF
tara:strand:+ start:540 stop:743 length:204 start_codon:yes stop_codon:yes gene_type:complete